MLAGGNGAGKSTFYEQMLKPQGIAFVNADVLARQYFPDDPEARSREAVKLATDLRQQLLDEGKSFCFETVFSHASKVDFIGEAKAKGYTIVLVFIHLDDPNLNCMRVTQRVAEGGHNVPTDKILSRIPRAIENVRKAIPLCDHVRILDNSDAANPYRVVLTIRSGQVECVQVDGLPEWAQVFLS